MELAAIALILSGAFVSFSAATYRRPLDLARELVTEPGRFAAILSERGEWGRADDVGSSPSPSPVTPPPVDGPLVALTWAPGHKLRGDAAAAADAMNAAYRTATGRNLTVNSSWRSRATQEKLFAEKGSKWAARPGTSKHELGVALDLGGTAGGTSATYKWLKSNAGRFGFRQTLTYEPWHWEYA